MDENDIFDSPGAVEEFKSLMRSPDARQAFVEARQRARREGAHMRYEHILKLVSKTPWAIEPHMLGVIVDVLAFRAAGGRWSAAEIDERIAAARRDAPPVAPSTGGVAVIPLRGVLVPRAGGMTEMSGGTSIESFRAMFRDALANREVSAIVLDVDSSGGMVNQVPEMAAEIRASRGAKPIIAVANTKAASAAYWLASQADQLIVSKSGEVGSIGVLTVHEDQSKANEMDGITTTLIAAGKYKTDGNPFQPLADEARAAIQGRVDAYYSMFTADVAKGRSATVGDVRSGFGQGRMVSAAEGVKQHMADGIATIDDVIRSLLAKVSSSSSQASLQSAGMSIAMGREAISMPEVRTFLGLQSLEEDEELLADLSSPLTGEFEGAEEPLPTTPQEFRAHLKAAAPGGHAMDAAKVNKEPDGFLENTHRRLHSAGNAGHTHPGLGASAFDPDISGEGHLVIGATATPVHHTPTQSDPWDGPANKARLKAGDEKNLRAAFAWYDPNGADPNGDGYPDAKSDYAFIHHAVSDAGEAGPANTGACSSAIGVLNGGRGVDEKNQPWSADRPGIHAHLSAHLVDAGTKPADIPPLQGSSEDAEPSASEQSPADVDELAARIRLSKLAL